MKHFLLLLFLFISFISCKKTIEQTKENALLKIMISGQWKVTKYVKGNSDITPDFAGYSFQFYENRTVEANKNGAVEKTGTWKEDVNQFTISSNFMNAAYPLSLLNGTFELTNSGENFVEGKTTVNGEQRYLRLDK